MEYFCQLEELVEAFLRSYAISSGYYDRCTFEVVLGCLYVVIEYFYDEGFWSYVF